MKIKPVVLINFFCVALFGLFMAFFGMMAQADPNPLPSGVPALNDVHAVLSNVSPIILAAIGMALELLFRLLPKKYPLSILWIGVGLMRAGIMVLKQVETILGDLANMADAILPQNAQARHSSLSVQHVPPKP